jgi:hypothetical protein
VFFHLESTHQVGFCGFTPDKNLEDKRLTTMERKQLKGRERQSNPRNTVFRNKLADAGDLFMLHGTFLVYQFFSLF